jgi:two-component system sensor histidine kinase AdeS
MNKETILSRQILTYMLSLTFVIIAIAVLGSYLFYSFLIDYLPGGMNEGNEDAMTFLDWMWILIASLPVWLFRFFYRKTVCKNIKTPE